MTTKEINQVYRRIVELLDEGVLKTAFDWVQTLISGAQLFSFQDRLDELQKTYRYMLDYFVEGSEDPMRRQIYAGIRTGAYELSDRIRRQALTDESQALYYVSVRQRDESHDAPGVMLDALAKPFKAGDFEGYESGNDRLFLWLWTASFLSEEDAAIIGGALKGGAAPVMTKCLIVSALMLSLQAFFDVKKLYLLFDAAESDDDEVRIRAFVSICLTLHAYGKRTAYYEGIRHRLDMLAETPDFTRILQSVTLRFILSRETEKVSFTMRNEIIPELIKHSIKPNPDPDAAELQGAADDMNPEWFEVAANSSLAKKIEEYSRLQEEGVDVMHSSFVDLKHFPFFRSIGHWFMPFIPEHSTLAFRTEVMPATVEMLKQASFMCNSDKYSLYFNLCQMPERQRMMVNMQMSSQLDAMHEQYGEALRSRQNRMESITGQYVQDLFRFYKLFPKRKEFNDVFKNTPEPHNLPALKQYLSDPEILLCFAELYLRKNYLDDAQALYAQLTAHYPDDDTIYQKLGYCKQMSGDTAGALDDYLRAEIMNTGSKWLIRRIGYCYKALKQPEKALEFYRRYETMTPGNMQAQILVGNCYMDMKDYSEALKYYFKADYMERDNVRAWRAVAWCSFMSKKFEQARNYYTRILALSPQTQDYLNAGHTEWAMRQTAKAFAHYLSAIGSDDDGFEKFLTLFDRDIPDLVQAGVDPDAIPLLLDRLRYT